MTTVAQTTTIHTVRGGGGLRLHVREWGRADGPPILLIHGLSRPQAQPPPRKNGCRPTPRTAPGTTASLRSVS